MLCQHLKALRGPAIPFISQGAVQFRMTLDFIQIMKVRKSLIRQYWFPCPEHIVQILSELAKI